MKNFEGKNEILMFEDQYTKILLHKEFLLYFKHY